MAGLAFPILSNHVVGQGCSSSGNSRNTKQGTNDRSSTQAVVVGALTRRGGRLRERILVVGSLA